MSVQFRLLRWRYGRRGHHVIARIFFHQFERGRAHFLSEYLGKSVDLFATFSSPRASREPRDPAPLARPSTPSTCSLPHARGHRPLLLLKLNNVPS